MAEPDGRMKFQVGITAEELDLTKLPKAAQQDLARIWLATRKRPISRFTVRFVGGHLESIYATKNTLIYEAEDGAVE